MIQVRRAEVLKKVAVMERTGCGVRTDVTQLWGGLINMCYSELRQPDLTY